MGLDRKRDGNDASTIRAWVRAVWRLPDGRTITRTVRRDVGGDPTDEEHALVVLHQLLEEVEADGAEFPEGHGVLVEVFGAITA